MKVILIQGSSRSNGNTSKIANLLKKEINMDIVHLADLEIGHYDYEYKNSNDDFPPLMKRIANDYDLIIFATPVYWFTMSGIMKAFFDRISDSLRIDKDTGRKLRGKSVAALSCGSGSDESEGFFLPFKHSAKYLGMNYIGDIHTWIGEGVTEEVETRIIEFGKLLNNS